MMRKLPWISIMQLTHARIVFDGAAKGEHSCHTPMNPPVQRRQPAPATPCENGMPFWMPYTATTAQWALLWPPLPRSGSTGPCCQALTPSPGARHGLRPTFIDSHPPPLQPVIRPVNRRHIAAHGPGDHLAVQGNVVHLLRVLTQGGFDELFALGGVGLFAGCGGQAVQLFVFVVAQLK